jgi:DNA repair protein RecO (recombination protein O)
MITNALEAWLIHRQWLGDTSAQVVFFTRERGIVRSIYRSARTPKKQSLLQLFTPLCLFLNKHRSTYYVRELEMLSPTLPLAGERLFSALYVNELIYHALHPEDAHPELYDAYVHTLNALSMSAQDDLKEPLRLLLEKALRRFERQWLMFCGYDFSWSYDVQGRAIQEDQQYAFKVGDGFFSSPNPGFLGAHLLAFDQGTLQDVEVLKVAKCIMRQAVDHALQGKPIKTRDLYR